MHFWKAAMFVSPVTSGQWDILWKWITLLSQNWERKWEKKVKAHGRGEVISVCAHYPEKSQCTVRRKEKPQCRINTRVAAVRALWDNIITAAVQLHKAADKQATNFHPRRFTRSRLFHVNAEYVRDVRKWQDSQHRSQHRCEGVEINTR